MTPFLIGKALSASHVGIGIWFSCHYIGFRRLCKYLIQNG